MRLAAVLVVLFASATAHADKTGFNLKSVYKVPRGIGAIEGPADAPITIVVWSDYACGYCNRVQNTLEHLEQLYPGVIRWVHRTLPLDEDYTLAAEAALAAGAQGRFKPMHERLFALRGRVTRAEAELVGRELGLEMIRFRADLDAGTYRKTIAADMTDAAKLGVSGTPTFFINGRPINGNQPLRVFVDVVETELGRAEAMRMTKPADLYEALVASGKLGAEANAVEEEQFELDPTAAYQVGLGLPGHSLGPDDALVTIVEFSDFQCPFCSKQAPVFARLRAKYGDQLRLVYRHFPMSNHRYAMLAAEAAAAAGEQGKFWAFHDELWKNFGRLGRADLEAFAQATGADMKKFRAALDERRYHNAVVAEAATAQALGVDGTPTLFINGQPVVGARDEEGLSKIVDAHISHAKSVLGRGLGKGELYPLLMSMARGAERADPASIPQSPAARIEPRADDRARSVVAACRRRDGARAAQLAGALAGDVKRRTAAVCAGEGIDLP